MRMAAAQSSRSTSCAAGDRGWLSPEREHVLARGTRTDERHDHPERVFDELDVRPRGVRKLVLDTALPSAQRLENGAAVVEVALVRGELVGLAPVLEPIANADGDLGELGQDVELRKRKRCDPVDADGEAKG